MNVNKNMKIRRIDPLPGSRVRVLPSFSVVFNMVLFLGGIMTASNVLADVTIVFKELGSNEQVIPIKVRDGKVQIGLSGQGESVLLFDSASNTITNIDNKSKSYTVVDEASLNMMANTMTTMQQNLMAQMKNLSPDKRAQMEAMMGQMLGQSGQQKTQPSREFRKTNVRKNVAEYSCTVIESITAGIKVSDICVVNRREMNLSDEDFQSLKSFFDFIKQMAQKFPGGEKLEEEFGFWASDENVVPVHITRYKNGKVTTIHQIEKLDTSPLDSTNFEVPVDYRKHSLMPGM